jgi:release factor glutamine methyltransferase
MYTVQALYAEGKRILKNAGIDCYAFDTGVLLEFAAGIKKEALILRGDDLVSIEKVNVFFALLHKREAHFPLQYLVGKWDFYGIEFRIGKGVLIPRPETEILISASIEANKNKQPVILDLCAGAGTVGLTLARILPHSRVKCIEAYMEAFEWLQINAATIAPKTVECILSDIRDGPGAAFVEPGSVDMIVSNPPYLTSAEMSELQPELIFEPPNALLGGEDGLCFYRLIAERWVSTLKREGTVFLEVGKGQHIPVARIFSDYFKDISFYKDLSGIPRVVSAAGVIPFTPR